MPRLPIDYSKTIIYKIVCKDLDVKDFYIGSTTQFNARKNQHKLNHNNPNITSKYNCKLYNCIRQNGYWDNWDMVMIEKFPCADKLEQFQRERECIEELKPTLNNNIKLNQTDEDKKEYMVEYRENNKEQLRLWKKNYDDKNRADINRKATEKIPCDICGIVICRSSLLRHKKRKHKDAFV